MTMQKTKQAHICAHLQRAADLLQFGTKKSTKPGGASFGVIDTDSPEVTVESVAALQDKHVPQNGTVLKLVLTLLVSPRGSHSQISAETRLVETGLRLRYRRKWREDNEPSVGTAIVDSVTLERDLNPNPNVIPGRALSCINLSTSVDLLEDPASRRRLDQFVEGIDEHIPDSIHCSRPYKIHMTDLTTALDLPQWRPGGP